MLNLIIIFNKGNNSEDLEKWKLFEANTNHNLVLYQGESILHPSKYAIITDYAETFLNDYFRHENV